MGRQYGLELNLEKLVLLWVRSQSGIFGSDGSLLAHKNAAFYLGGLVTNDGKPRRDLTRRLGEARHHFRKLTQARKHTYISSLRKHQIFESCIVSRYFMDWGRSFAPGRPRQRGDLAKGWRVKAVRDTTG